MSESSHWGNTLNTNRSMCKAMRWPPQSIIILTSEIILALPGKLLREPVSLSLVWKRTCAQMKNHVSTTDLEGTGSVWWLTQSLLNLNPIAIWCPFGPCEIICWSLSSCDERKDPATNSSIMISTNRPTSEDNRRAEQPARQNWALWCDTSELGSPSLGSPQEGNLLCLYLLRKYHHLEVPNVHDHPARGTQDSVRDLLQTTVAENGTLSLVPSVSVSAGRWTKLAHSAHDCPLTHPWFHSAILFLRPTCARAALGIKWGFYYLLFGRFSAFLVALSDSPGTKVRSDLFLGPWWHL